MVQTILIAIFIGLVVTYVLAITFPELATVIITGCDALVFYISQGVDILWLFLPQTATLTIAGLAIAVQIVVYGYKFVMWILRKVPTAGIN